MERLTEQNPSFENEESWLSAREPDEETIDKVYFKLRDYENTKRTPEQIENIKKAFEAYSDGNMWEGSKCPECGCTLLINKIGYVWCSLAGCEYSTTLLSMLSQAQAELATKEVNDKEFSKCAVEQCVEIAALKTELQGAKANNMISNSIIENGSNPADKDKIVSLIMENSALKAKIEHLENARQKQAKIIVELNGGKYEQINKITELKTEIERLKRIFKELKGTALIPFNIGQTVFCKCKIDDYPPEYEIIETVVTGYEGKYKITTYDEINMSGSFSPNAIFSTREEAEQAKAKNRQEED